MKFSASALMVAAALMLSGAAYADGACTAGADITKSACCGGAAESVAMAKGGAAKDNSVEGYRLGQKVPNFTLADASGNNYSLADYSGKVVALIFWNQECPYVIEAKGRIDAFQKAYAEKGVQVLAVDAGVSNPKENIAKEDASVSFPILINNTSDLAVNFNASRTPEVFVLNKEGVVVYHGAFDNGQNASKDGRRSYAEDAVKAALAGEEPEVKTTKAFGCTIKFNTAATKTAKSADAGHEGHDHSKKAEKKPAGV